MDIHVSLNPEYKISQTIPKSESSKCVIEKLPPLYCTNWTIFLFLLKGDNNICVSKREFSFSGIYKVILKYCLNLSELFVCDQVCHTNGIT